MCDEFRLFMAWRDFVLTAYGVHHDMMMGHMVFTLLPSLVLGLICIKVAFNVHG
jgi:hypothetical protein